MKPQVAPLERRTFCLRIVPKIGAPIRLTQYPRDLAMGNGAVYLSSSGYDFTGYSASSTLSPAMVDVEGIAGLAGIGVDQIQSGVFDNARCYLFACDWAAPVEDFEPIAASIFGKTHLLDQRYKIEEMALVDALNQSVGKTYTAACPKRLGGQEFAGCKINLAAYTVTGAVASVASPYILRLAGRTEAADYFAQGTLQFTSGANAGLKPLEIKAYALDGSVELYEPFYYAPAVGDAYSLVAGCRKRLQDCRDKFNNVLNFGGFTHVPTTSQYTQRGLN